MLQHSVELGRYSQAHRGPVRSGNVPQAQAGKDQASPGIVEFEIVHGLEECLQGRPGRAQFGGHAIGRGRRFLGSRGQQIRVEIIPKKA